jgi:hypothetical protein
MLLTDSENFVVLKLAKVKHKAAAGPASALQGRVRKQHLKT